MTAARIAIPPLRTHYAIAQIRSDFRAGFSRETEQRAKSRLISTRLAARCRWHIDCFYHWQSTKTAVHRIVSAIAWLKLRDKLKAPHLRKLGAVVAMPDGSHIPVSDRTRSESRMVNDATLQSAHTTYFRKRSDGQNGISGMPTRSRISASPTVLAHLIAQQGES